MLNSEYRFRGGGGHWSLVVIGHCRNGLIFRLLWRFKWLPLLTNAWLASRCFFWKRTCQGHPVIRPKRDKFRRKKTHKPPFDRLPKSSIWCVCKVLQKRMVRSCRLVWQHGAQRPMVLKDPKCGPVWLKIRLVVFEKGPGFLEKKGRNLKS